VSLSILSCGIFRFELERILPEIREELGLDDIRAEFLPPALGYQRRDTGKTSYGKTEIPPE
jgi:hypothetical protein